jgi:serine/threonine protein kinase
MEAEAFTRDILRSKLLRRDELQRALNQLPRPQRHDARLLAEHLIRLGKLTRFQASKLLKGVTKGLILGPFRILSPLGKGGMGTVFLVRDQRNDQLAALKTLPPRYAREARMLARFRREMEICVRLDHRHIARAYEVGEHRGVHFIAMEYIPGQTLSKLVQGEGPLDMARAARLFAELAEGLHHAHGQGVIHRDLKPSNVLITPRDTAKLVDLGLALMHGETGDDTTVIGGKGYIVGTMDYIAPEQTIDALSVGPRSDLYALGCSLYYALVGHPPFPGGTSKEKVMHHRHSVPTPLAELRPGLPAAFVDLIERLMCKDPEGRPLNAAEAGRELRMWAEGGPDALLNITEEATAEPNLEATGTGSMEYSLVSLPEVEDEPETEEEFLTASIGLNERRGTLDASRLDPSTWWLIVIAVALFVLVVLGLGLAVALLGRGN